MTPTELYESLKERYAKAGIARTPYRIQHDIMRIRQLKNYPKFPLTCIECNNEATRIGKTIVCPVCGYKNPKAT